MLEELQDAAQQFFDGLITSDECQYKMMCIISNRKASEEEMVKIADVFVKTGWRQ